MPYFVASLGGADEDIFAICGELVYTVTLQRNEVDWTDVGTAIQITHYPVTDFQSAKVEIYTEE